MKSSHHDDYRMADDIPLPVMHLMHVAAAIRQATYRMQRIQLAPGCPPQLNAPSLTALATAFEDLTRGLAHLAVQVAASLPDSIDQHPTAPREIRDRLHAFQIAVLDASAAARALGPSATSTDLDNGTVPHQRRR